MEESELALGLMVEVGGAGLSFYRYGECLRFLSVMVDWELKAVVPKIDAGRGAL